MKKTISIMVPTYNEEENVVLMHQALVKMFQKDLPNYNYEILFIDNKSKDNTRKLLRQICEKDKNVKAIFNAQNFGQFNSPYYGLINTSGDCTIGMAADFQDPIDMIPKFVKSWEEGYKIVIGIKNQSKESKIMYFLRSLYYKMIKKFSEVEQIEHFTGFGLYDKRFIEVLKNLDDPDPYLRGIVSELGFERKEIPFTQPKRERGKSSNNWYRLYDAGMLGITSYTKVGLRMATILGFIISAISVIVALIYLVLKLCMWNSFQAGIAPLIIGVFLLGGIQIFFIGFLGEYILSINQRIMHRPLVVVEEKLNFKKSEKNE
ncbi:MAG: glycosyltransferase family 2 protein [Bacilli bacterium]|nr:glycosyltransferase family 2 protein [Bacilli bacterium]